LQSCLPKYWIRQKKRKQVLSSGKGTENLAVYRPQFSNGIAESIGRPYVCIVEGNGVWGIANRERSNNGAISRTDFTD
jgi:hypothetical protein